MNLHELPLVFRPQRQPAIRNFSGDPPRPSPEICTSPPWCHWGNLPTQSSTVPPTPPAPPGTDPAPLLPPHSSSCAPLAPSPWVARPPSRPCVWPWDVRVPNLRPQESNIIRGGGGGGTYWKPDSRRRRVNPSPRLRGGPRSGWTGGWNSGWGRLLSVTNATEGGGGGLGVFPVSQRKAPMAMSLKSFLF